MFGFQRRRVARFEWDTLFPKLGLLPHRSQIEDTFSYSLKIKSYLKAKDYLAGALIG
jgi:hypothetical protein